MEEEIIKDIEDLIKILDFTCESGKSKNADDIRTLLDLYNKEKEKNKELEKERDGIYDDYQDLGKEYYKIQQELEQNNKEWEIMFDTFNEREYRKKYLEERRKEQPNLLYPDADEIYQRYYEEKEKNKSLKKQIKAMQEYYKNSDFIFKDKIKEKMKEILGYTYSTAEERQQQNYAYDRLKELLEEEN